MKFDLDLVEKRAAVCAHLIDVQDAPAVTLNATDAYAIRDVLVSVPALVRLVKAERALRKSIHAVDDARARGWGSDDYDMRDRLRARDDAFEELIAAGGEP